MRTRPDIRAPPQATPSYDISKASTMATFILWLLLFIFCWPLALLALVLYPLVWLLTLPFRLVGISVGAVFALLAVLLFLPARVLGHRR